MESWPGDKESLRAKGIFELSHLGNGTYSQLLCRGGACDFCVLGRFPLATLWSVGWEGQEREKKGDPIGSSRNSG